MLPAIANRTFPPGAALGVDLASVSSAAVVIHKGVVLLEFDSLQGGNHAFVDLIAELHSRGLNIAIEDVPPGVRFDLSTKDVCRIQGRIQQKIGISRRLEFVPPNRWMHDLGYKGKNKSGSTAAWAKEECTRREYTPPEHSRGSKLLQDYRSARLIAEHAEIVLFKVNLKEPEKPAKLSVPKG